MTWRPQGVLNNGGSYWKPSGSLGGLGAGKAKIHLLGQRRSMLAVRGTQCGKQQLGRKVLSFWWINQLNIPLLWNAAKSVMYEHGNWKMEHGPRVSGTAAASAAPYPAVMPSVRGGVMNWWILRGQAQGRLKRWDREWMIWGTLLYLSKRRLGEGSFQ